MCDFAEASSFLDYSCWLVVLNWWSIAKLRAFYTHLMPMVKTLILCCDWSDLNKSEHVQKNWFKPLESGLWKFPEPSSITKLYSDWIENVTWLEQKWTCSEKLVQTSLQPLSGNFQNLPIKPYTPLIGQKMSPDLNRSEHVQKSGSNQFRACFWKFPESSISF